MKPRKIILRLLIAFSLIYLLLLIPDSTESIIKKGNGKPYLWDKDQTLKKLEDQFVLAKKLSDSSIERIIDRHKYFLENKYVELSDKQIGPANINLQPLLNHFFNVSCLIAVKQENNKWLIDYYNRVRVLLKEQSRQWNYNDERTKQTLYEFLYGMRAAVEEVLLQNDSMDFNPLNFVSDEQSATTSAIINGIKVHSGDIFVSRGGAEVSALISRGNDYPGNFSHIALLYVDSLNTPLFIEAHIEKGLAIATAGQYLKDKKLRFMVLRPRTTLSSLQTDVLLPDKAAKYLYNKALNNHVPYDFKMNFQDTSEMFCSEVASYAYKKHGITLWKLESTISSAGVVNWLNTFGVENFNTQMPSDLEYDPQLSIIAEWRDPETLFKDHIDNAVIDVMLEGANNGEKISYNIFVLPFARILKGYCMLLNLLSLEGTIPEGMSATQALKNKSLVKMHSSLKNETQLLVEEFIKQKGYTPPYWELMTLARKAKKG